jgi:pyruvate dehydrogenase E1 component
MSLAATETGSGTGHGRALREIEQRVLWLATASSTMPTGCRPDLTGLKVGAHRRPALRWSPS